MTVRATLGCRCSHGLRRGCGFRGQESGSRTQLAPVLVAKQLIPAGTPGHVVAARGMAKVVTDVPAEVGAISRPELSGGARRLT